MTSSQPSVNAVVAVAVVETVFRCLAALADKETRLATGDDGANLPRLALCLRNSRYSGVPNPGSASAHQSNRDQAGEPRRY
jgi:hypothetical protein